MRPPRSILNRDFRYVPAAATDVAKTFARERARLEFEARPKLEEQRRTHRAINSWLASVSPPRKRA